MASSPAKKKHVFLDELIKKDENQISTVTMQKTRFVWRKFEEVLFIFCKTCFGGFDLGTRAKPERRPSTPSQSTSQRPHFSNSRSLEVEWVESTKTNDLAWMIFVKKKRILSWGQGIELPSQPGVFSGVFTSWVFFFPTKAATFSGRLQPTMDLKQRASYKCPTEISKTIEATETKPENMMKGPWNPQLVHWFIRILLSWLLKSSLYNLYKRQGGIIPCVQQMSRLQLSNEWARCAVPKASLT